MNAAHDLRNWYAQRKKNVKPVDPRKWKRNLAPAWRSVGKMARAGDKRDRAQKRSRN